MRIGFVSLALLSLATFALAHQSAQDKAAMEQKQKDFVKAIKAKDTTWFEKNETTDFQAIDGSGKKHDRKDSISEMKQVLSAIKVAEIESTVQSVKPQGKDLIVRTYSVLKGTLTGRAGKPAKLVDISTDDETWVKSGNDWKLKIDKTVSEKATLDGKPIGG